MSDYGLKVSLPGYDVKTATDQQLVISSKYNSFKIANSLQGQASFSIAAGVDYTYTITHSLGYVPAFDAWFTDEHGVWHSIFDWTSFDIQAALSGTTIKIYAVSGENQYATSSLVHLMLHNRDLSATYTVYLYYIIFIDSIS